MAEQVPYGVATSLINTLASSAFREIASIYGVESDIEWLKNTAEGIKAVLVDADQKQQNEQLIQLWIRDLKQVLYEADDLLDEIQAQHLLRQRDAKGKEKVRDFFSSSNPIAFRLKIARNIRNIREMFNDVVERMSKLNLDPRVVVEVKHEKSSNWRETCSFVAQEEIVGREGSKKDIIDLLLNPNSNDDSNNQNVSLVAIVGIGGLGKTALAQLVYNDADVERFFDKRMWVCVSEDFDVKALVKQILESLLGNKEDDQPLELLQSKLQRHLDGQRYLLVLDDVWNEDREKWLELKKYLMCGAKGSKILMTTRNQTVANKMSVKTPYLLKGLKDDQSWTLLKRMAFDEDKTVTQNLESIGRKIAEKCAGIPLAIRVMGSMLQSKSRESDWEAILEGDFWKLCKDNYSIMPILKLSYDSLEIELKQCLTYCSLYPKDWNYNKKQLIGLWMAQGFLEIEDEKLCPEDLGEEYVHTLLMKSFLQDVETDELGEIKYFKIHDLMHDLSQSIASSDNCLYIEGRQNVARCPVYASFENYNFDISLSRLDLGRLRTFLEIQNSGQRSPSDLFVYKCLRHLDFGFNKMRYLPKSIGKMIHLRYLDLFGCSELTTLPKSISNLVHLETLRLERCYSLKFSVDIIAKLINLRQLDIGGCKAFEDGMPVGMGEMTTLQSLSDFIVSRDDNEIKKAKLNELKELNLRGILTIRNLDLVRDVDEESKHVNLITKKNLVSLTLDWGKHSGMENSDAMQLLENLRPHQNLKALKISWYPGVCLPHWNLSCTNLVELKFNRIRNCQYLAALEGFVSLKSLDISGMDKLECIYVKGCSSSTNFFPSLEDLKIDECPNLRGWQREENVQNIRDMPPFSRLSSLDISHCRKLSHMPTFPNLVKRMVLVSCSTKPLLDTLKVNTIGPSTLAAPLSMLKFLKIGGVDIESLPEKWMQNLSSIKHLSICSSLEEPFRHMRNLSATLEELTIWGEGYCNTQYQNLYCLHSLQKINFIWCDDLIALPEWICDLQSLRFIGIFYCLDLVSFPEGMCRLINLQTLQMIGSKIEMDGPTILKERCKRGTGAEWSKIAHIPNILFDGDPILTAYIRSFRFFPIEDDLLKSMLCSLNL